MDIPQILQFVDEAVCAKTGKHLNDLQRRIITGILKGQKYAGVAETYGYSAKHIKKASHELLRMLSDVFGEDVKKRNLESVLDRQINVNITFGTKNNPHHNVTGIGYIYSCPDSSTSPRDKSQPATPDSHPDIPKIKIETVQKLRHFGLRDEQIAEALELPLEVVKQVDFEE
ncbi:hypothetical protein [Kamptonema formosum]|uniref:hypothetical protein n=1 Tax=Kamptonema formosum TaxID=331992 RepID=UPI0003481449|nr:hypothetical protein [Oscillatoria sp. PCC 10802]